jgi:hypothetical protein
LLAIVMPILNRHGVLPAPIAKLFGQVSDLIEAEQAAAEVPAEPVADDDDSTAAAA